MAGKVRVEKGDKFRLVEKRRKTGNKATGLKGLKTSDGKAGVSSFFPCTYSPPPRFSPLTRNEPKSLLLSFLIWESSSTSIYTEKVRSSWGAWKGADLSSAAHVRLHPCCSKNTYQ